MLKMISQNQIDKASNFLKLHKEEKILTLLNSWDPGSSKLIEASGFEAIGTTSMGISASLGYPDCQAIPFQEMVDAVKRIVEKVTLPVTADIEGGYGKNINEIVNSSRQILLTGIVGINIEDSYDLNPKLVDSIEFCERISAIREMAKSLGIHLVINARTDVFITSSGSENDRLKESIDRGNKYQEAGADCIFIPDVWQKEKIRTLVQEIDAPINILSNPTNGTGFPPSIKELEEIGVARVSLGSSLMKSTLASIRKIGQEVIEEGTYKRLSEHLEPISETLLAYKMATEKNKSH